MTLPTIYDDTTLAAFMLGVLGDVGSVLGMTTGSFPEAINDVLLVYGVADLTDADDIAKVRALARVEAWKLALVNAASRYDVSDGTQSLKRSQLLAQIKTALGQAQEDASDVVDIVSATASRSSVIYADDPYQRVGGP